MAMDGILIHYLTEEIKCLETGRINKITQLSASDYLFIIRIKGETKHLFVSVNNEYCRVNLTQKEYESDKSLNNFTILLRKYMDGGIINEISQHETDRVIKISINKNNELGDRLTINLIIELTGRHSNIILLNNNTILGSYKHIMPFDNNDRTIIPNAIYEYPKTDKLNPFNYNVKELENEFKTVFSASDLTKKFLGISLILANYTYNNPQLFYDVIHNTNPVIIKGKKTFFYYNDLKYLEGERTYFDSISQLIDSYFYTLNKKEQIKAKSKNILQIVKNKIQKQENKLEKLYQDLDNAKNNENDKINGELLFANIHNYVAGSNKIEVFNYYTNENITIPLDPLLGIKQNANKYYTLYQKKKNALNHIPREIAKCQDEINYLLILEQQIIVASLNDIEDIKKELNEKKSKVKGKKKITLLHYLFDSFEIIVGKNNIQNAHLIKEVASPNDLWFHIKDAPSSHVILKGEVCEKSIRNAAMIASYYSKQRFSSSIAVDYTLVKYLKRIPNKKNCFVSYTNQKTIYIDVDTDYIESLKQVIK